MTAPSGEWRRVTYWFSRMPLAYSQITHPCLTPPLGGIPFEILDETYPAKTRGMGLLYSEKCMILASTVFDWSTHVTDRQTDGRAIAYSALSMLSRAKNWCNNRQVSWVKFKNSNFKLYVQIQIISKLHKVDWKVKYCKVTLIAGTSIWNPLCVNKWCSRWRPVKWLVIPSVYSSVH